MGRFTWSDCRWQGLEKDWPSVGVSLSELPSKIPPFQRYASASDISDFHTFVDDWRQESIWRDPFLKRDRVVGIICTAPDFSIFWGDPLPFVVWQVWRSRLISWAWSQSGAKVIPVVQFGDDRSFPECVRSVIPGSVIAVRGPSRTDDLGRWRAGCGYWAEHVKPDLVIQFGRDDGADVWPSVLIRPLHVLDFRARDSCSK